MSNQNGISGKAANKLHILLFKETSAFASISPVFQCLELNFY